MNVEIRIQIDRGKSLDIELERLTRFLKTLDKHPDGIFTVVIEPMLI